jgi:UDP-N-acetylmuramoylalanine--D-glutamate ligase
MNDLANRRISVIGLARTGLAVADVAAQRGARVTIYDKKPAADLTDAIAEAKRVGAEVCADDAPVDLDNTDLLVPSPGVPRSLPVLAEAVRRGIEVISEIELAYRISSCPIIGITGTNGKTTTTILTGQIMAADGRETFIAGNVAAGDIKLPLISAAHRASGLDSVIVAEISTFQLEWIAGFRPKIAALLNVTADHLDRHADVHEYAALKARIFENQGPGDYAIINAENPVTASLAPSLHGRVLKFARLSEVEEGAFVRGNDLVVRIGGRETTVCTREDIPLRGEHNVENVLAASCAAIAFGARPESIVKAVRDFREVEHRLEPVERIDGVLYINNSMCTNVDAAVRSVEAIAEPQIVIAGGKDKGSDYRELGEALARKAKHVILVGADADLIGRAAQDAGFDSLTRAASMQEAVEIARSMARPGDVVVLTPACASFDMFTSFEHRGQVFKDAVKSLKGERSSVR